MLSFFFLKTFLLVCLLLLWNCSANNKIVNEYYHQQYGSSGGDCQYLAAIQNLEKNHCHDGFFKSLVSSHEDECQFLNEDFCKPIHGIRYILEKLDRAGDICRGKYYHDVLMKRFEKYHDFCIHR